MEKEDPLVTIVVPVYNMVQYLAQCLDSVVGQTYSNLEIIVVDDGSTDGSGDLCGGYAERDHRVVVLHTANGGLSAARNLGIEHAQGEYLLFVDSDDWMDLDTVAVLVYEALSEQADIVCCRYIIEWLDYVEMPRPRRQERIVLSRVGALGELAREGLITDHAWGKLYRSALCDAVAYPVGMEYEDVFATHQIIGRASRIVCVPNVLWHYRMRSGSIMHKDTPRRISDRWLASKSRYAALTEGSSDLREGGVKGCATAVLVTWKSLHQLSPEERATIAAVLDEMSNFAREHGREVMCMDGFSLRLRLAFLCARWQSPIVFAGLHWMGYIFDIMRRRSSRHMYP